MSKGRTWINSKGRMERRQTKNDAKLEQNLKENYFAMKVAFFVLMENPIVQAMFLVTVAALLSRL